MKRIEVNDIVRVTDWGWQYSAYTSWFKEFKVELNLEWIIRYAYGDNAHYEGHRYDDTKYKVLFVATRRNQALITGDIDCGKVYLIDIDGIELYDKPTEMTISEVEEKLGIKNLKIIKENNNG